MSHATAAADEVDKGVVVDGVTLTRYFRERRRHFFVDGVVVGHSGDGVVLR